MKKFLYILIALVFISTNIDIISNAAPVNTPAKKVNTNLPVKQTVSTPIVQYPNISPLLIVDNPKTYLNKTVSFSGEFVSFTSLGLDYKPAFRDSSKYIGILVKRPDIKEHTIPLSEMKIFMSRELAEKNADIETGDKFYLTGKVFSTALGDPWLDITSFKITSQKTKKDDKK